MRIQKIFMISVLVLLCTSIFSLGEVYASTHELETLDLHVFIEEDGRAIITEKRIATLSKGSENYIVIGNLGESTITDFDVYEDEKRYDYVEDWNVDVVVYTSKKGFFRNKKVLALHFDKRAMEDLKDSEAVLFNLFTEDAVNGLLKKDDVKAWSKKNDKLISKLEEDLVDKSLTMFEEGILTIFLIKVSNPEEDNSKWNTLL